MYKYHVTNMVVKVSTIIHWTVTRFVILVLYSSTLSLKGYNDNINVSFNSQNSFFIHIG